MFSEKHVALFIDGDSIPELMQKGHDTLLDEISKKEATINAAKRANKENKTYLVCQKFDKSYWFVLQEKYIEKQYNDKIVKTIHPER